LSVIKTAESGQLAGKLLDVKQSRRLVQREKFTQHVMVSAG